MHKSLCPQSVRIGVHPCLRTVVALRRKYPSEPPSGLPGPVCVSRPDGRPVIQLDLPTPCAWRGPPLAPPNDMTSKNSNPPETDSASILGESVARVSSPDHITQNPAESCGGSSPTHFNESGKRLSKRERIRSRNPFVKQVSKLEPIGSSKRKSRASDHRGRSSENGKKAEEEFVATTDIGILADSDYDEYLLGPVAWLRRRLIASLRWESKVIAWHQRKIRHPLLDRFFVYTSLLGTHSFFLIVLPTTFWLGDEVFARGLVNSLAFGVYLSSAIKDLFCVPRPYSPPVTRLAIGSVHLEYGFLSTHSTNGVGMALYIYLWVLHYRSSYSLADDASCVSTKFWEVGLLVYTLSVVYGRVYAGMHSVVDCLCGSLLGAGITLIQWWLFGAIEAFLTVPGWLVPFSIAPACLLMIYVHPEPLDDCPCFEDGKHREPRHRSETSSLWLTFAFYSRNTRKPLPLSLSFRGCA